MVFVCVRLYRAIAHDTPKYNYPKSFNWDLQLEIHPLDNIHPVSGMISGRVQSA